MIKSNRTKIFAAFAVVGLLAAVAMAATSTSKSFQRFVVGGVQIYDLRNDGTFILAGPRLSGNSLTAPTLPTTTTGSYFANWVPVYNPTSSAIAAGTVLVSSNVAGGVAYVAPSPATTDLTTVCGVAAEAIAALSKGWMVPRGGGYAVLNATGTVAIGDTLTSTATYAGGAGADSTPTTGADFATAMSAKSGANAGTVLAILH